jgi:2-methylcitrate dehydratase PrpD
VTERIIDFIHGVSYSDLPAEAREQAVWCTLDLCGALAGGVQTKLSRIIRDHAHAAFGGNQASLLLDGRRSSAPGAALATATTVDALDIHDSHRTSLGHAGVHVFAAVVAVAELLAATGRRPVSGEDFLTALVVGYDIGCRAGIVQHATTAEYYSSGAWAAVSSAALYSRLVGLSAEQTRHALGIGEHHGPRARMMRVIDHPTMLKDASGWGAMAGVSAGMLAEQGFTGAPAFVLDAPEGRRTWANLGSYWYIMEQGFKPHGVCWWAQPAIEAALSLMRSHDLAVADIAQIRVETFEKATRLAHPEPRTTEEAQFSLPYPVAAALWNWADGRAGWYGLGPQQLLDEHLGDPRVLDLARRTALIPADDLTRAFPGRFLARVTIEMQDARRFTSPETTFRGELDDPLTASELRAKFRWLAGSLLPPDRVEAIANAVFDLPTSDSIDPLLRQLIPAP